MMKCSTATWIRGGGICSVAGIVFCLTSAAGAQQSDRERRAAEERELDAIYSEEDAQARERQEFLELLKRAKPAPMPPIGKQPEVPPDEIFEPSQRGVVEHDLETGSTRVVPTEPGDPLESRTQRSPARVVPMPQSQKSGPPESPGAQPQIEGIEGQQGAPVAATPPSPILNTTTHPFNTVVKLLMRFNVGGTDFFYVCSAETVESFHLLTAGHCIYNHDPNDDGNDSDADWADEVWAWSAQTDRVDPFDTPDWPYGVAKAIFLRSYTGWTQSELFDHDWAVITLDRRLGDHTGWMGVEAGVTTSALNFSGYPAETPYVPAGELRQYPGFDSNNVLDYTSGRIEMDAFTYGGHSGGPVWRYDGTNRYIEGMNSTSNRSGYAEATLITNGKFNDLFSWISDDQTARPPLDRPDLIEYWFAVNAKDLLTNNVVQGDSFSVEYNALNAGFVNSGAGTEIDFYLSTNTTISTFDTLLGTRTFSSGINAFSFVNVTTSFTVPLSQSPGTYYVGWIMTSGTPEYGSSQNDNTVVIADETLTVDPAPPDLIVRSPGVSDTTLDPGQSYTASAEVHNQGSGAASSTTLRYFQSTNSIISTLDTEIGTDFVTGLAAGSSSPESASVVAPNSEGSWWIGACVDSVSGESNTGNQCSSGVGITVVAPTTDVAVGLNGVDGPDGSAGAGWTWIPDPSSSFGTLDWVQVSWPAYNSANGETRPAWCDLDGDGTHELVLGLGSYPTDGGWLEVRDDADASFAHLAWLQVPWGTYNAANGETWPGCGDVDDDGRDEIVAGLGGETSSPDGQGWFYLFDDAVAGYGPHPATPSGSGWLQLGWASYNSAVGETRPAVGDLDGDAGEEIVLGLAPGSAGWVQILDDAGASFAPLAGTPSAGGWLQLDWPSYNSANGETWPAVCDLDGDGDGEAVLGVGANGAGWGQIRDSASGFGTPNPDTSAGGGWFRVGWSAYNSANGAVHPACGLNVDVPEELLLGLGSYPGVGTGGWLELKDDLNNGLANLAWPRVPWADYNTADGLTRPAIAR